jgi:5-methylcytosine-specific restriction endonuclease McrA
MTRPDECSRAQVEVAALPVVPSPVLGVAVLPLPVPPVSRAVVQPLSPERYRVQFTIGRDAHDILRRVQTLLRREIPDGDAGAIFERALRLLHMEVEAAKFGRPRKSGARKAARQGAPSAASTAYENRIRPGADAASPASRYIPKAVKRAVWYRDRAQCAFVSASGQRCAERDFLELHHIHPYALKGAATVTNIALRCRTHNAYEAEMVFGARRISPASG